MNIFLVKPGVEQFLTSECALQNLEVKCEAPGILSTEQLISDSKDYCFPFWILNSATILKLPEGKHGIESICSWFCEEIRNERIDKTWYLFWLTGSENGFTPNISKQDRIKETLKKRISRICKLADSSYPVCDTLLNGLFVVEDRDSGNVFISRAAFFCGQRRMKDDISAPSRSYLKIEEAFSIFGRSPLPGETAADLGAAPGGWTWAALKRGANVFAIDNGPLKKGPLDHPNVNHLCCDAFTWEPTSVPLDWLFCDMVEQPLVVIERIRTWFSRRWCRNAIVNFKYGYSDPSKILELLHSRKGLKPFADTFLCRHLFHDRDEITVIAKVNI